jgi:hypothetical protein
VSLRGALDGAAAGLADIDVATGADGSLQWSRAGLVFAVLGADGSSAEFALDPAVAAAAARTPDVVASGRGPGWVRFGPAVLDDHGVDRAIAWFISAHRRASRG